MEKDLTIRDSARSGKVLESFVKVAKAERVTPEEIASRVADGTVVVPMNPLHKGVRPTGIGKGLRVKINANLGTSTDRADADLEHTKLAAAEGAGADAVMDLSTGGDIDAIRRLILSKTSLPLGTVPIYTAAVRAAAAHGAIVRMTPDEMFAAVEDHAKDGVDFMTIHSGVTLEAVDRLRGEGRICDIVSRGGSMLTDWMLCNEQENPFHEQFDRLLALAAKYEFTLSLGDGLRPGAVADATDRAQIQELITLGEQADRCAEAGVQVMIEGPGHVPLDQVPANVLLEKRLCHGAPFYVLGPLVTDVAPGYDHVVGAIGGAVAALAGADFLCYVTPSEHLRLPTAEDVREGVITARIAGHAADLARGLPAAVEWDEKMSRLRKARNWDEQLKLALDPEKPARMRADSSSSSSDVCTMCGEFCAMKLVEEYLRPKDK